MSADSAPPCPEEPLKSPVHIGLREKEAFKKMGKVIYFGEMFLKVQGRIFGGTDNFSGTVNFRLMMFTDVLMKEFKMLLSMYLGLVKKLPWR